MFNVIAIKQAYPGHARQAGLLAASCQSASYLGRFVVVVDEDVDPTDMFDVMWAICTRCDPAEDIEIIRRAWCGPARSAARQADSTNSRAVIDACRPFERLKDFPMVARASPELRRRWRRNSPASSARSAVVACVGQLVLPTETGPTSDGSVGSLSVWRGMG